MNNTYTGKRETWEQKFTYYNNLSNDTLIVSPNPDISFDRIVSKNFTTVLQNKELNYVLPLIDDSTVNDQIDAELLNFKFLDETGFQNNNPYKFLNKIIMHIDKITFQTFNFYNVDNIPPNDDRNTSTIYENLNDLLPLQIKINNKEIDFGAADGITQYSVAELGFNSSTNEIITDVPIPGNSYIESYDKDFELSSVPQKFDVEINFNGNILSDYLSKPFIREFFYDDNINNRIDRIVYRHASLANIRIDGRIISTIDYDKVNEIRLSAPKRVIEQPITLNNIELMLKKLLPEKEKKELLFDEVFKTTTQEDAQDIVDQIINSKEENITTDIIQSIKETAENIYS